MKIKTYLFVLGVTLLTFSCQDMTDEMDLGSDLHHDIPQNVGVENCIKNALQLVDITYKPILPLRKQDDTFFSEGQKITGMLYSSTRIEENWVPNNVSYHTFLSSLTDENSLIYTTEVDPSVSVAGCIYGTVCTQFVNYCLGIKVNYMSNQYKYIPGMELVKKQTVDELKLGDVLLQGGKEQGLKKYSAGHVRLITDILRDDQGKIVNIGVAESVPSTVINKRYSASVIRSWMKNDGYSILRYKYIDNCKHVSSPYVELRDSVSANKNVFNKNIMPNRGDKANYHVNEDVIINIKDRENYDKMRVYKGDVLVNTIVVSSDNIINLGKLDFGTYKVCLANGNAESDFVYFIKVDYSFNVENQANGNVKISFKSKNATPICVSWVVESDNFPRWYQEITPEDLQRGYIITKYRTGQWGFKCNFETSFGIISSEMKTCYI